MSSLSSRTILARKMLARKARLLFNLAVGASVGVPGLKSPDGNRDRTMNREVDDNGMDVEKAISFEAGTFKPDLVNIDALAKGMQGLTFDQKDITNLATKEGLTKCARDCGGRGAPFSDDNSSYDIGKRLMANEQMGKRVQSVIEVFGATQYRDFWTRVRLDTSQRWEKSQETMLGTVLPWSIYRPLEIIKTQAEACESAAVREKRWQTCLAAIWPLDDERWAHAKGTFYSLDSERHFFLLALCMRSDEAATMWADFLLRDRQTDQPVPPQEFWRRLNSIDVMLGRKYESPDVHKQAIIEEAIATIKKYGYLSADAAEGVFLFEPVEIALITYETEISSSDENERKGESTTKPHSAQECRRIVTKTLPLDPSDCASEFLEQTLRELVFKFLLRERLYSEKPVDEDSRRLSVYDKVHLNRMRIGIKKRPTTTPPSRTSAAEEIGVRRQQAAAQSNDADDDKGRWQAFRDLRNCQLADVLAEELACSQGEAVRKLVPHSGLNREARVMHVIRQLSSSARVPSTHTLVLDVCFGDELSKATKNKGAGAADNKTNLPPSSGTGGGGGSKRPGDRSSDKDADGSPGDSSMRTGQRTMDGPQHGNGGSLGAGASSSSGASTYTREAGSGSTYRVGGPRFSNPFPTIALHIEDIGDGADENSGKGDDSDDGKIPEPSAFYSLYPPYSGGREAHTIWELDCKYCPLRRDGKADLTIPAVMHEQESEYPSSVDFDDLDEAESTAPMLGRFFKAVCGTATPSRWREIRRSDRGCGDEGELNEPSRDVAGDRLRRPPDRGAAAAREQASVGGSGEGHEGSRGGTRGPLLSPTQGTTRDPMPAEVFDASQSQTETRRRRPDERTGNNYDEGRAGTSAGRHFHGRATAFRSWRAFNFKLPDVAILRKARKTWRSLLGLWHGNKVDDDKGTRLIDPHGTVETRTLCRLAESRLLEDVCHGDTPGLQNDLLFPESREMRHAWMNYLYRRSTMRNGHAALSEQAQSRESRESSLDAYSMPPVLEHLHVVATRYYEADLEDDEPRMLYEAMHDVARLFPGTYVAPSPVSAADASRRSAGLHLTEEDEENNLLLHSNSEQHVVGDQLAQRSLANWSLRRAAMGKRRRRYAKPPKCCCVRLTKSLHLMLRDPRAGGACFSFVAYLGFMAYFNLLGVAPAGRDNSATAVIDHDHANKSENFYGGLMQEHYSREELVADSTTTGQERTAAEGERLALLLQIQELDATLQLRTKEAEQWKRTAEEALLHQNFSSDTHISSFTEYEQNAEGDAQTKMMDTKEATKSATPQQGTARSDEKGFLHVRRDPPGS